MLSYTSPQHPATHRSKLATSVTSSQDWYQSSSFCLRSIDRSKLGSPVTSSPDWYQFSSFANRSRCVEMGRVVHWLPVLALAWASLVSITLAFRIGEYSSALDKTILFYDLQRSGRLPTWQRLRWRGNSGLQDGRANGVDLTGGYYDAGDNMKFGLPMAYSMTMLAWSINEFSPELRRTGQLGNALNNLRWGTDYFLKAHRKPNELWVQVGSPWSDHDCWQRPEDMTTPRPAFKVDAGRRGSDVAAETAAALAAASISFRGIDPSYSARLLRSAQQLFSFADRFRGKYSDSMAGVVCPFYCSYSGFNDELLWGAAWLARATGNSWYSQYLLRNQYSMGGSTVTKRTLNWDDKMLGAQVLMAQGAMRGRGEFRGYKGRADQFMCSVLPRWMSNSVSVGTTRGGLLYFDGNINMQYVASTSFLLTVYAKHLSASRQSISCGGRRVTAGQLYSVARRQADYILGANPKGMSYLVGFGRNNPKRIHHRAASLPSMRARYSRIQCKEGFNWYNSWNPNPNQATGAILGGPDQSDNINDSRGNYAQMEPTTYINAPMVGVFAALGAGRTF